MNRFFRVLLIILSITLAPAIAHAQDDDLLAQWHELAGKYESQRTRALTAQYRLSSTETWWIESKPVMRATGELEFKGAGEKFYKLQNSINILVPGFPYPPDPDAAPVPHYTSREFAFDASVLRWRTSVSPNTFGQTRRNRHSQLAGPKLPWDYLTVYSSRDILDSVFKNGRLLLRSIEPDPSSTDNLTRVTIDQTDTGDIAYELWFDQSKGHHLVKAKVYSDGEMYLRLHDVKVQSFKVNDHEYFLPVQGTLDFVDEGELRVRETFTIDVASVKFDQPLDEQIFHLTPRPGEEIHDDNLHLRLDANSVMSEVQDPAAYIDSDAGAEPLPADQNDQAAFAADHTHEQDTASGAHSSRWKAPALIAASIVVLLAILVATTIRRRKKLVS